MRHEVKFRLSPLSAAVLRSRLPAVMAYDAFNVDTCGKYRINSLYFDTPGDLAMEEKVSGISKREKFRLRYYNTDSRVVHLEKKLKVDGLCDKLMACMSHDECQRLLDGDIEWMLDSGQPLIRELYGRMRTQNLQPRVLVNYQREAFVYPAGNVRITLDSDIRTGLRSVDFLNSYIPLTDTQPQGFALLEVKFDAYLPRVIADIIQIGSQETAFSKFEACHIYD